MKQDRLHIVLLFCLAFSSIALAWLSRKPICLEGKILDRVSLTSDSESYHAVKCNNIPRKDSGVYNKSLFDLVQEINRRLFVLESFVKQIPWLDTAPLILSVQDYETKRNLDSVPWLDHTYFFSISTEGRVI